MSQVLNSLVVAKDLATLRELENIMANNISDYVLSFTYYPLSEVSSADREPDLIFIENNSLTETDIRRVTGQFPGRTYVVLDEAPENARAPFRAAGIDEVMSFSELRSNLGRHLLEKLLTLKHLADARARVARGEERFRSIIEHSGDIIVLLDRDGNILYVSPAFARQAGYEMWTVLGRGLLDFAHDDGREALARALQALVGMPAAQSVALEFLFQCRDGRWATMEATGSNLLGDPNVGAMVLHMRDVTLQKQAEVELKIYRQHLEDLVLQRTREAEEANRRADTVIAASPDALIALDENGYITFVSRHYRSMYPKSTRVMSGGGHISEAFDLVTKEAGISTEDAGYQEMKRWWEKPKGSMEFKMPNGTWVRCQARRMPETNGIVVSTTNITDYKRQQALLAAQSEEMAEALAKERAAVEQQKTFVSMVSHEFRTPLTVIDGNAQIIHSRGTTIGKEVLERRAVTIRGAVDRLVRLIDTILSSHALDTGKLALNLAPCELGRIIRGVCSDQQDISPNHRIRCDVRGLPERVLLDEKIVRQMLANLVSNAVKYSPASHSVEVMAFREENQIVVEVQDHGVGIPEAEIPHVFSKYFRASTASGIPGSGLGLTLVKDFVDLHQGTVNLRSKVGIGTVVTVTLPIRVAAGV
jgi:PAS domain S-box-containing protein